VPKLFTREVIEANGGDQISARSSSPYSRPEPRVPKCTRRGGLSLVRRQGGFCQRQGPFSRRSRSGARKFVPGPGANNVYNLPGDGHGGVCDRGGTPGDGGNVHRRRESGGGTGLPKEDLSLGLIYPPQCQILDASLHVAERLASYIFDQGLARVPRPGRHRRGLIRARAYRPGLFGVNAMAEVAAPPTRGMTLGFADPRLNRVTNLLRRIGSRPRACNKIVVVGGGAAGLDLVTRSGDRLGRRRRASVALGGNCPDTSVEAVAGTKRAAGSMDPGEYELNYPRPGALARLPLSLGRDDRASIVPSRKCSLGATFDDEGRQIHAAAVGRLRHAGHRDRQASPTISAHPGVCRTCGCRWKPRAQAARFNRRLVNACIRAETQGRPGTSRPAPTWRSSAPAPNRRRIGRRAVPHDDARSRRLRARSHRSRSATFAIVLIEAADPRPAGSARNGSPTPPGRLLDRHWHRGPHRSQGDGK